MGIFYARGKVDIDIKNLKKIEGDIQDFDFLGAFPRGNAEIFEFKNAKGKKARIGVNPCDGGFHLWLIADNGMALRT